MRKTKGVGSRIGPGKLAHDADPTLKKGKGGGSRFGQGEPQI